jgi:DNA segregation ATPase FtsK/SpoIIIE-like protein
MAMTEERLLLPSMLGDFDENRIRRIGLTVAGGFAVILFGFWAWWPAGVALGLIAGSFAVLHVGRGMQARAFAEPAVDLSSLEAEEDLREEFVRLRTALADDWSTFSRAAVLVTQAQWASVAGLQRELRLSTATAQHILGQLEREGFVGPSRGSRPRVVRLPRERVPELERLLQA